MKFTQFIALNTINELTSKLFVCGYNIASTEEFNVEKQPFANNLIAIMHIQFEALYSDLDVELSKTLYHVSPKSMFKKIQKNGLVPSSKSLEFKYSDRLYLFNQATLDLVIAYGQDKIKTSKEKEICIYKIDRQKLKDYHLFKTGKLKFYLDPSFSLSSDFTDQTAIFTYGVIPRSLIDDIFIYIKFNDDGEIEVKQQLKMQG